MSARKKRYIAPEPLGRAPIRYFARAIGDDNRLYTDAAYAQEHGYHDVIAPPTLICETNQYADLSKDEAGYAGHGWDIEVPGTRLLRGGNEYTFHQAVSPDDIITASWRIQDMTEKTTAKGIRMLIVTSVAEYSNQHDELLVTNAETLIFQQRGGAA